MTELAPGLLDVGVLVAALLVDRFVGEWPARAHPVCWMGSVIRRLERRAPAGNTGAFLWGLGMAVGLPLAWGGLAWATLQVPVVAPLVALYWLKSAFALRLLGEAGMGVATPLSRGDLAGAREGLRSLCSRDPSALDGAQLAAGTVESLAENLSDSFVAPLFWWVVAGVPGAVAYRAINTADAMIGYHGRYEWLGKAAARVDDAANVVPARLTAVLLLLAGIGRADVRGGLRALLADRRRTESPNAGWPMATMAGLLGVVLAKPGHYALGEGGRLPAGADVDAAWALCTVGAAGWVLLVCGWLVV
ncbi:MAG: adenosylcobinamide-phosphate synthase CbiB [Myxococcota bacterium]